MHGAARPHVPVRSSPSAPTDRAPRRRVPVGPAALALFVAVLGGLAVIGARSGRAPGGSRPPGEGTVVRVIDGDTLVVAVGGGEERVRLIGIDTPESVARDRPNECFGPQAARRLAELLPVGTVVRLTRDVEPRDVYDRLLAYVQRQPDGLFVNEAQVAQGYAVARDHPPNTVHRAGLEQAERAARAGALGLWPRCGGADTPLRVPGPDR